MMKRKTTGRSEFAVEDQLLPILEEQISVRVVPKRSRIVRVFRKLPVGLIVPDLVLVALTERAKTVKHGNRVPSMFECEVLATLIRRGPMSRSKVMRLLYARKPTLDRAVARLARDKLLRVDRDEVRAVCKSAFAQGIRIVSIEAKLLRWKDAIRQAKEYRRFSNHSYVALPRSVVEGNSQLQEACVQGGVGLISVSPESAHLVLRTKNEQPITADWFWLVRKTASLKETASRVPEQYRHVGSTTLRKRSKA